MFKKDFIIASAILFIGAAIIINGYFIRDGIIVSNLHESTTASVDNKVLNLSQAAEYLKMTEEEIQGVMQTEKDMLKKTGSFSGKMFPYFTINNKTFFYKNEIDEWLKDVSNNHREYNTIDGWVL